MIRIIWKLTELWFSRKSHFILFSIPIYILSTGFFINYFPEIDLGSIDMGSIDLGIRIFFLILLVIIFILATILFDKIMYFFLTQVSKKKLNQEGNFHKEATETIYLTLKEKEKEVDDLINSVVNSGNTFKYISSNGFRKAIITVIINLVCSSGTNLEE